MSGARNPTWLKAALALHGVHVDTALLAAAAQPPGTIELELPRRLPVSAPVLAADAATPFRLSARDGHVYLAGGTEAGADLPIRTGRPPRFYEQTTSQGTPMAQVGVVQGRHLVLSPGGACGFSVRGTPCPFCLEGARASGARERRLHPADVVEVVRAARAEGVIDTVYFNSCAFDAEDGGIGFLAPYVDAVRRHVDLLIAVQVHPPATAAWVDRTYAMGVDALSYNLEIFDPDRLLRECVGRARYIGRDRYLEVLARAAQVFPSGTVWSELVVGLEPQASTMAGIETLADLGVLPVLTVHRAAARANGQLEPEPLVALLAHLARTVRARGLNMGWIHGLPASIAPLEAAQGEGPPPRVASAMQALRRGRVGGMAVRNLARLRRRLRVRRPDEDAGGH